MPVEKIGIVGLGLIGGSIAKTVKSKNRAIWINAYNKSEAPLIEAKRDGAIDSFTTSLDESFSQCDIIFICTPVDTICSIAGQLAPIIKKDCIITDVGSTKKRIFDEISAIKGINYVGGHPMAGSEKNGYSASKDYLFENAYYILSPMEGGNPENVEILKEFAAFLGAIPVIVGAREHDYAAAAISHVPHVIAAALVNTVKDADESGVMHILAAGGFKDITRIASSDPGMWTAVSLENRENIIALLDMIHGKVEAYKEYLNNNDCGGVRRFFESSKAYRDTFSQRGGAGAFMQDYIIYVDVEDRPGQIASVSTLLYENGINIKNIGIMNNRESETGVMQVILPSEESRESAVKLLKEMNFSVYEK